MKSPSSNSKWPLGCLPYICGIIPASVWRWPQTWTMDVAINCRSMWWLVKIMAEGKWVIHTVWLTCFWVNRLRPTKSSWKISWLQIDSIILTHQMEMSKEVVWTFRTRVRTGINGYEVIAPKRCLVDVTVGSRMVGFPTHRIFAEAKEGGGMNQ